MSVERDLFLVDRHTDARDGIRLALLTLIGRVLRSLAPGDWYGDAGRSAAASLASSVATAQRSTADLTWAYMDALLAEAGQRTPPAVLDLPTRPRGVDAVEVWERPLKEYRYRRSLGIEHDEAVDLAVNRAETIADDDLTLGMRHAAAQHSKATPGVIGLRRVVHPERSRSGSCGLCIAASDRVYKPGTLLPIHDRCRCTVAEITKAHDPGNALNNLSLSDLYTDADGTSTADLKRTRYKVNEHGELGAVLMPERRKVRTKSEVKADTGTPMDPHEKARKQLGVLERSIADLERRQGDGEEVTVQLTYQRSLRARLAAKAA